MRTKVHQVRIHVYIDLRFSTMWHVRPASAHSMTVELLTEHHLEFLSLNGGYTSSSESTLVKIPHCWKSLVTAQLY